MGKTMIFMYFVCPHCSKKGIYFISKAFAMPSRPATCYYCNKECYVSQKQRRNRWGIGLVNVLCISFFVYLTVNFNQWKFLIPIPLVIFVLSVYEVWSGKLIPIDRDTVEKIRNESKKIEIIFSLLCLIFLFWFIWSN